MNLNMGNLTLEVNVMKNKLVIGEKEKAMLQEELDKEREFQKGYKHNVEIWRKKMAKVEQKNKTLIKKLQDENEELNDGTSWLKLQDETLQNLNQKVEIWETTKKKWTKTLFLHKKQQEALDSQMKALTKEKKEKENVLIDLELINLKNVSILQFEEFKRKTTQVEIEQFMEDKKEYQRTLQHL